METAAALLAAHQLLGNYILVSVDHSPCFLLDPWLVQCITTSKWLAPLRMTIVVEQDREIRHLCIPSRYVEKYNNTSAKRNIILVWYQKELQEEVCWEQCIKREMGWAPGREKKSVCSSPWEFSQSWRGRLRWDGIFISPPTVPHEPTACLIQS